MDTVKFKLIGVRPLLMHADIFCDPLNPLTKAHKELTSKRKKSDEDHEAIAKSEWRGGLYYADDIGPYLPGINIESAMIGGGKLQKLGTTLKRSTEVMDDYCRLEYSGPRTVEELWAQGFYDARSVKVQSARLIRYRPMFRKWSCECEIAFNAEIINRDDVIKSMRDGGMYSGVGDFRPKFGRFEVEVL